MIWRATGWKGALLHAALGGAMLLGSMLLTSGTAQAADCRERIRNEEWKLQRDVNRHGFFSRQARHDRQRIAELREGCRVNHGWRDRDDPAGDVAMGIMTAMTAAGAGMAITTATTVGATGTTGTATSPISVTF